uniref:Uncharacterized protein n=1 Tax=Knipowitschia caucasica TaxID=637954 RepID=A0AAV2M2J4_KNICA
MFGARQTCCCSNFGAADVLSQQASVGCSDVCWQWEGSRTECLSQQRLLSLQTCCRSRRGLLQRRGLSQHVLSQRQRVVDADCFFA